MMTSPLSYANTPVADGALTPSNSQNPNYPSAQTRNAPVEPQTPNRVSSPEQVASAARQANPPFGHPPGQLVDVHA
ncbi:MAG: hypothetical protein PF483_10420 [Halothiobacillus sp.]|jgi:hypothetical protein|uniref:hypothetical protein n=1 Tax=Halothiobacillus sp. TaxID=1891311 RepID=UPI002AD28669|nr:hypothetical protein [Halothiobacillus sp.]MDA3877488.1 hypothetical protein [Halothiobacillus sp.]